MKKRVKVIRLNKKGIGEDIDWIIAVGIFLIYLVLTIVYFKPGIKSVFNPDNLIGIVEDGFSSSAYWDITTQPMFIQMLNCKDSSPTVTCLKPNQLNQQVFEFKGEYGVTPGQGSGKPSLGSQVQVSPLNSLKQDNTQIFFVKPDVATTTSNANIVTERSASEIAAPTQTNPATGATILPKTAEEIRNIRKELKCHEVEKKCERENNDECDRVTYQKCLDLEKELAQAIARERNAGGDNNQPSQESPVNTATLTQNEFREGYVKFKAGDASSQTLKMQPFFIENQKSKYLITSSNRKINDITALTPVANLKGACLIPSYDPNLEVNPNSECLARYELGVAETLKGISLPSINSYAYEDCNEASGADQTKIGYNCIKQVWGYPENKEFKIRIYDTAQTIIAEFPVNPAIPSNVNVYSKQFNSFILNDDGIKKQVTVAILVW